MHPNLLSPLGTGHGDWICQHIPPTDPTGAKEFRYLFLSFLEVCYLQKLFG